MKYNKDQVKFQFAQDNNLEDSKFTTFFSNYFLNEILTKYIEERNLLPEGTAKNDFWKGIDFIDIDLFGGNFATLSISFFNKDLEDIVKLDCTSHEMKKSLLTLLVLVNDSSNTQKAIEKLGVEWCKNNIGGVIELLQKIDIDFKSVVHNYLDKENAISYLKPYFKYSMEGQNILHSLLIEAVHNRDILEAKEILSLEVEISQNGDQLLLESLKIGDKEIIKSLLERGIDPNINLNAETPLIYSILSENLEVVNLLLSYGANPNLGSFKNNSMILPVNFSALDLSIENNPEIDIGMAESLIEHGATYGGILPHGLSKVQKQFLDKARETYISAGKELDLVTLLNVDSGQQFTDFLGQLNENYPKVYDNLSSQHKALIDKDVIEIYDIYKNSESNIYTRIMEYIKSLGGYRYTEPSPLKEMHFLVKHIETLMNSYSTLINLSNEPENCIVSSETTSRDIPDTILLAGVEHSSNRNQILFQGEGSSLNNLDKGSLVGVDIITVFFEVLNQYKDNISQAVNLERNNIVELSGQEGDLF